MVDSELVRMELKGFMKEWTSFIKGIVARECSLIGQGCGMNFVQEELRDEDLNGGRHKNDDENISLSSQVKKGKFKNISSGESTSQDGKKKYMRKIQVLCMSQVWELCKVNV
jgi:hypothetical protein